MQTKIPKIHIGRTGIYNIHLRDGDVIGMISDPNLPKSKSFQSVYEHCVPVYKKAKGSRLNLTIRCKDGSIPKYLLNAKSAQKIIKLDEHSAIVLWTELVGKEQLQAIHDELLEQLHKFGNPDHTFVFGKTHTNNGRKILELANEKGQTYRYAGKTTSAGQPFGPLTREFIENTIVPLVGVDIKNIWAHLVLYPDPSICKLSWHGDSKDGINPHCIISLTMLEDKINGPRPFQVRKKRKRITQVIIVQSKQKKLKQVEV